MPFEEIELEDDYILDLEEEFDLVLGCDIGLDFTDVNKLDGCSIHRDSDDDSVFVIHRNNKVVGKIAIYYEDD